jgi:autotransporter-associated beta strand protein
LYLQGDDTLLFSPGPNQRQVIADGITDEKGSGGTNGSWSVVTKGPGTTVLSGANHYSGGTSLEAGTLEGTAASFPGHLINTAANTSLVFNQTNDDSFHGAISGGASVTKTGPGTLTLANENNIYTGGTTITAGALRVSVKALKGKITNNASLILDQPSASAATYAGTISGTGSLTKVGGEITLTGANTYAGDTTVVGGILRFTSLDNLGKGAVINLSNGTLGTTQTAPLQTISRAITLTGAASGIDVGGPPQPGVGINPLTWSGIISGSGILRKTGGGPLFLTGTNTYSGGTSVVQGVLRISADANLGAANTPVALVDNSVLQAAGNFTITRPVSLTTSLRAKDVGGQFQVDNADIVSVVGEISGNGALIKLGTGTLDLRKAKISYSGGTIVHGGKVLKPE